MRLIETDNINRMKISTRQTLWLASIKMTKRALEILRKIYNINRDNINCDHIKRLQLYKGCNFRLYLCAVTDANLIKLFDQILLGENVPVKIPS
jgi:hypothetical protein